MKRSKRTTLTILRGAGLAFYLALAIFPLLWIFITSIKPPEEVYTFPIKYWPSKISWASYEYLIGFADFGKYFLNSIFVSISASLVSTTIALFSGYVFARMRCKGKYFLVIFLFFMQMIPAYLLMIPQYTMFSNLNLINRLSGIILVYIGLGAAFSTIMEIGRASCRERVCQ